MTSNSLAQGLMAAKGEQLRSIYVLMKETGIISMVAGKTKDIFDKKGDHSQKQLDAAIRKLDNIPDDQLRLDLFLYMTKEFGIAGSHYTTSLEIQNKCKEILQAAHTEQLGKDKKYKTFVSRQANLPIDSQLALYQIQKLFESIGGEFDNLSADQQETFAMQIEEFIESLPAEQQKKIKEKLNIDAVTNNTVKTVIATQGSAVLLTVIVEIAGFTAYTTLTSAMAGVAGLIGLTLPFSAYITATSLLSVLTGPVGLLLIGGVSGVMMMTQGKKVKRTLLQMGIVQIILPVLLNDSEVNDYSPFIREWKQHCDIQTALLSGISALEKELSAVSLKKNIAKLHTDEKVEKLIQISAEYEAIVLKLSKSLALVDQGEMPSDFNSKMADIQDLKRQRHERKITIGKLKNVTGFSKKISNAFSSMRLEKEAEELGRQIREMERSQAIRLITVCPERFHGICAEALEIDRLKATIKRQMIKSSEEEVDLKSKLTEITASLSRERSKLQQLQKDIYGLEDIV